MCLPTDYSTSSDKTDSTKIYVEINWLICKMLQDLEYFKCRTLLEIGRRNYATVSFIPEK